MGEQRELPQHLELWGGVEATVNRVGDSYIDQLAISGHAVRLRNLAAPPTGAGRMSVWEPCAISGSLPLSGSFIMAAVLGIPTCSTPRLQRAWRDSPRRSRGDNRGSPTTPRS